MQVRAFADLGPLPPSGVTVPGPATLQLVPPSPSVGVQRPSVGLHEELLSSPGYMSLDSAQRRQLSRAGLTHEEQAQLAVVLERLAGFTSPAALAGAIVDAVSRASAADCPPLLELLDQLLQQPALDGLADDERRDLVATLELAAGFSAPRRAALAELLASQSFLALGAAGRGELTGLIASTPSLPLAVALGKDDRLGGLAAPLQAAVIDLARRLDAAELAARLAALADPPALADWLALDPAIEALSSAARQGLATVLAQRAPAGAVLPLWRVAASAGFAALAAGDQQRLLLLLSGDDPWVAFPARAKAIALLLDSTLFSGRAAGEQAAALQRLLRPDDFAMLPSADTDSAPVVGSARPLNPPKDIGDFDFHASTAPAVLHELQLASGRVLEIIAPRQPVPPTLGFTHTPLEVAEAMASLPSWLSDLITRVSLEPGRNPDDDELGAMFHSERHYSYMTVGYDGMLSIYPVPDRQRPADLRRTLVHEGAHLSDGEIMRESPEQVARWRQAGAADGVLPSGYAAASVREDFAEAATLYVLASGTKYEAQLRQLFPARFAFLDKVPGLHAPLP